jgi:hypothetical protein
MDPLGASVAGSAQSPLAARVKSLALAEPKFGGTTTKAPSPLARAIFILARCREGYLAIRDSVVVLSLLTDVCRTGVDGLAARVKSLALAEPKFGGMTTKAPSPLAHATLALQHAQRLSEAKDDSRPRPQRLASTCARPPRNRCWSLRLQAAKTPGRGGAAVHRLREESLTPSTTYDDSDEESASSA